MIDFSQNKTSPLTQCFPTSHLQKTTLNSPQYHETNPLPSKLKFSKEELIFQAASDSVFENSSPTKTGHSIVSTLDGEIDTKQIPKIENDSNCSSVALFQLENSLNNLQRFSYTTSKVTKYQKPILEGKKQIGAQEYFTQLNVYDPLGQQKLFSIKQKLLESSSGIFWDFSKDDETQQMFFPKVVLIPSINFQLQFQISPLKASQYNGHCILNFCVSTSSFQQKKMRVKSQIDGKLLEMDCQRISNEQKKIELQKFNFKPDQKITECQEMIKILRIRILFKQKNIEQGYDSPSQSDNSLIQELKTQEGSKKYQKQLQSMSNQEIQAMVLTIEPCLAELMNNQYANYFIQQVFPLLSTSFKTKIISELAPSMKQSLCSAHGTFVFQFFIDHFNESQQYQICTKVLQQDFAELSVNQYGSHAIRKFIQKIPQNLLCYFLQSLQIWFMKLSNNKQGVCVIKNMFRRLKTSDLQINIEWRAYLINILCQNIIDLVPGQYSNYLIQQICESYPADYCQYIYQIIANNFYAFNYTRYTSIFLTKCFRQYWKTKPYYCHLVKNNLTQEMQNKLRVTKQGSKLLQQIYYRNISDQRKIVDNMNIRCKKDANKRKKGEYYNRNYINS